MIRVSMTPIEFRELGSRLCREHGLILSGRGGVAEHRGCSVVYHYDGVELTLEVPVTPFWMSSGYAERRLRRWMDDPQTSPVRTSLSASVALLLCSTLLMGTLTGCTDKQQQAVKSAVAEIGTEIPKLQPLITAAAATADLVLPDEAFLITGVTTTVQLALATLGKLCVEYAAAPSDSVWQSIIAVITELEANGANAILDAARITNPQSRALAQAALGALQTAILLLDGVVQRTRTSVQNAVAAQARTVKLSQIQPFLDRSQIEQATHAPFEAVMRYETALGY